MTAGAPLAASVVIPTHQRRESVLRLLRALAAGTLAPGRYEVVVVVDGGSDGTAGAVRREPLPFPVRVIEQTPNQGVGAARNRGVAAAAAELIVFIDDDIEPLPTLLETHLRLHERARAAGGDALVVVGAPLPVRPPAADFQRLEMWLWWERQFERMRRPGHRFGFADVFTGILSLPRALFEKAGGFDPAFTSGRDDAELGARLIEAGARVVFAPEGGGWHHELRDRRRLLARKRAEGRADVRIAERHPRLWDALPLARRDGAPRSATGIVRRLAFAPAWAGGAAMAALPPLMDALQALRLRAPWRRLQDALAYYWYWRGVADALGSRRALARMEERCAAARGAEPPPLDLDLAAGLEAAERRLDEERPAAARILHGGREVGCIPARPGAERLRGAHLRPALAGELSARLMRVLADIS
ncbi:MAG TPA: glycosyltransferase [Gemmatimonadaceae bacterium]|nr:glycosyltransferase [Gemmatimonadaceae bacterium]